MFDDFTKYELLRKSGAEAVAVWRVAADDGLDAITRIRLIRSVYSLSLSEAKDVLVKAEGWATSKEEHEGKFVEVISKIFPAAGP